MTDRLVVSIPVAPDGPAMRRRRGELPPARRPRLNAYRLGKFADRVFNDRAEAEWREVAVADWRDFLRQRFRLGDAEQATLESLPTEVVEEIADAVRRLVDSGGALSITLPEGRRGGELTLFGPGPTKAAGQSRAARARPAGAAPSTSSGFKIPIVKCTFDANCRNWRCRPG